MSGVFFKYKERFAPNKQTDLMNIIESDKRMFQEYKKFFNREKMQGICRHLCDYVMLSDLLANKESFVEAFDSIEKKRSLVDDLIEKVKSDDINSDELDKQKLVQKADNDFDKVHVLLKKQKKIIEAALEKMGAEVQGNFMKEVERIFPKEVIRSPFLAMKKPKILTIADLNLAAMNQGRYTKISYKPVKSGDPRHAVLIKKNSDNSFACYDPNYGAVFDLTEEQLCDVVTQSFYGYIRISKLGIVALCILLTSVVVGIVAAVYGYNIIATVSLIICLVDLSISCYLREELMPQMYNTIVSADNLEACGEEREIELKNLIDKYLGDNGKLGDTAVEGDVQVESITKENLILGNTSNL